MSLNKHCLFLLSNNRDIIDNQFLYDLFGCFNFLSKVKY